MNLLSGSPIFRGHVSCREVTRLTPKKLELPLGNWLVKKKNSFKFWSENQLSCNLAAVSHINNIHGPFNHPMSGKSAVLSLFGIILEPNKQSINTKNLWWTLPTLSSRCRYFVDSYQNIFKNWWFVLTSSCGEAGDVDPLNNLACTAPCTMLGTKSRWPGASKIVNCLENNGKSVEMGEVSNNRGHYITNPNNALL